MRKDGFLWRGLPAVSVSLVLAAFPALSQLDSAALIEMRVKDLRLKGFPLIVTAIGLERVTVTNIIPNAQSNETWQDSEPNLAVNPSDPRRIVASAFTLNPTGDTTAAPVFISTDGGATWAMTNTVPSGNGMTADISLDFGWMDNTLYTGILRGNSRLRQMILRSANPFGGAMMTTLTDHNTEQLDQPYVTASTTTVSGIRRDRVYVGFNEFDNRTGAGGNGRTASAEFSLDARTAAAPAGFTTPRVEVRTTAAQDMPAVRYSVHGSGVIYGIFYRWASGSVPTASCDIVVIRDDTWATGTTIFGALTDPADGLAGRIVAAGRTVPAFPASLGANRLVASNLSVAVNPTNAAEVYVAWADRVGTTDYTLHVQRSTDSGANWSADLLTITNATNPALAINSSGVVGFLYQQLTGTAPNRRWETHVRRSTNGTSWSDLILADTPDNTPAPTFQPYIGDYCDLLAVGRTFYGIFSATNTPTLANFPQGVRYLRNADFSTNQLRNGTNSGNVNRSIDPFFFTIAPPRFIDYCMLNPDICGLIRIDPGRIRVVVEEIPTRVIDPIPENCLVKWDCPGCGPTVLCPPYYHIYIDDLDTKSWIVQLFAGDGEPVPHEVNPANNGIVLSFRPNRRFFRDKEIGDYYLGFETAGDIKRGEYSFKTRLEVSDYPFAAHLKHLRR